MSPLPLFSIPLSIFLFSIPFSSLPLRLTLYLLLCARDDFSLYLTLSLSPPSPYLCVDIFIYSIFCFSITLSIFHTILHFLLAFQRSFSTSPYARVDLSFCSPSLSTDIPVSQYLSLHLSIYFTISPYLALYMYTLLRLPLTWRNLPPPISPHALTLYLSVYFSLTRRDCLSLSLGARLFDRFCLYAAIQTV